MPVQDNVFSVADGMAKEIFIDKYSRLKDDGTYQSWEERIYEVIEGNFSLDTRDDPDLIKDKELAHYLGRKGILATSGRHLQHGDLNQKNKLGDYYINCFTSLLSFIQFLLLLKGGGVGRSYNSSVHFVDWEYMPNCRFVLSSAHADYEPWIESLEEAKHKYDSESEDVRWFDVEDSAEGWVKVITIIETAAFNKNNKDSLFVFNLTPIRAKGMPIKGQQNRPASGPVPFIEALTKIMTIKGAGFKPWKQALFIDHYLAACVVLGGVRRSSRIGTKYWKDRDIFEYIDIKRGGWLYSANLSIGVDAEFWEEARDPKPSHGRRVFEAAISAAYWDNTGEPGFVNFDKVIWNSDGLDAINADNYIPDYYVEKLGGIHYQTKKMISYILEKAKKEKYPFSLNPCAEHTLFIGGGNCDVGDVCVSNADNRQEFLDGVGEMAKFLIRVNTMPLFYKEETKRTNRIGVSLIGIHECAAKLFDYSFYDLIDEEKSMDWWKFIEEASLHVEKTSVEYSAKLGLVAPHTNTNLKPAGTVAKAFSVTEAANLLSMETYLRWIKFTKDNPMLEEYKRRGYPVKDVSKDEVRKDKNGKEYTVQGYSRTCVVGFPTKMPIVDMLGERLVCAGDITLEQHYKWLSLLEKYWLRPGNGAQISYTMKYDPDKVSYNEFREAVLKYQPLIRCCAFSPQINEMAYIYTPEERISPAEYDRLMEGINRADREAIDEHTLACANGSCGIELSKNTAIMDEGVAALHAAE